MITKFNDHSDVPDDIYCHTPIENLKQMQSHIKIKLLIMYANEHACIFVICNKECGEEVV